MAQTFDANHGIVLIERQGSYYYRHASSYGECRFDCLQWRSVPLRVHGFADVIGWGRWPNLAAELSKNRTKRTNGVAA